MNNCKCKCECSKEDKKIPQYRLEVYGDVAKLFVNEFSIMRFEGGKFYRNILIHEDSTGIKTDEMGRIKEI